MIEDPYVYIEPLALGYKLTYAGAADCGLYPVKIGDSAWRPTRRMAESRARRWVRRVERRNDREEAAWSIDGSSVTPVGHHQEAPTKKDVQ